MRSGFIYFTMVCALLNSGAPIFRKLFSGEPVRSVGTVFRAVKSRPVKAAFREEEKYEKRIYKTSREALVIGLPSCRPGIPSSLASVRQLFYL
jgi:hypothetical protein